MTKLMPYQMVICVESIEHKLKSVPKGMFLEGTLLANPSKKIVFLNPFLNELICIK
jgi:hypothetical protein